MGEMNTADLAFGIVMLGICTIMTFCVLGIRYAFTGGVLGGTTFGKYASGFFLFFCWFLFLALNILNCYDILGNRDAMMPYDIDLNAAQLGDPGIGCIKDEIVQPIVATNILEGYEIKFSW